MQNNSSPTFLFKSFSISDIRLILQKSGSHEANKSEIYTKTITDLKNFFKRKEKKGILLFAVAKTNIHLYM